MNPAGGDRCERRDGEPNARLFVGHRQRRFSFCLRSHVPLDPAEWETRSPTCDFADGGRAAIEGPGGLPWEPARSLRPAWLRLRAEIAGGIDPLSSGTPALIASPGWVQGRPRKSLSSQSNTLWS